MPHEWLAASGAGRRCEARAKVEPSALIDDLAVRALDAGNKIRAVLQGIPDTATKFVSTLPGVSTVTDMPRGFSSSCSALEKVFTNALEAE